MWEDQHEEGCQTNSPKSNITLFHYEFYKLVPKRHRENKEDQNRFMMVWGLLDVNSGSI